MIKFPQCKKFAEIKQKVSLKIEGNRFFSEGVEFQMQGRNLLKEARKLQEERKFELALVPIEQAINKYTDALKKFEEGVKLDERFKSSIDFVRDQIITIEKLKSNTETKILNLISIQTNRNAQQDETDENVNLLIEYFSTL